MFECGLPWDARGLQSKIEESAVMKALSNMWRQVISLLMGTLLAGSALTALGQATTAAPSPNRKTSTPYTGDLSIFDYPEREQKLHINRVMDLLNVAPGKSVADIGAGSGWFTVRAARRVTATGRIYAVDINPEAIAFIQERVKKDGVASVITILGTASDPKLPPVSVDSVLLLKTYHEIAKPVELMQNLRASLRPGARVGIIDREGNGENHGVAKKIVIAEVESAGYRLAEEHDDLVIDDKMDYFLIFTAP